MVGQNTAHPRQSCEQHSDRNCTSQDTLQFTIAIRPALTAHPRDTFPKAFLRWRQAEHFFSEQHAAALLYGATNTVREKPATDAATGLWLFAAMLNYRMTTKTVNKYYTGYSGKIDYSE